MLYLTVIFLTHLLGESSPLHGFVEKSGREILLNSSRQGLRPLLTGIVGKGREQDAEALSSSDSLSLIHMDVLNAENAGAFFCHVQIFHKIRAQLRFLG